MPWLFFAALIAAGGVYYVETKKKAAPRGAPAPVAHQQIPSDPVYGQVQDFFGQARSLTRQFDTGAHAVAAGADDVNRTAIAASGAVSSIAQAVGSLAKIMPGVFKDLGIDGNPPTRTTPGGLHLDFGSQSTDQTDLHLNFGNGADQAAAGESLGLDFGGGSGASGGLLGNLGLDFGQGGAQAGNDLGADLSSSDSPGGYPNNMFPIHSGTAGTSSDGVTADKTLNFGSPDEAITPDMTQAPIETPQQSGNAAQDYLDRQAGSIPNVSESNVDYQAQSDAWGDGASADTGVV